MTTDNTDPTNVSSNSSNLSDKNQPAPTSKGQNRRETLLKGLALIPIPSVLAACGGGGDAELGGSSSTASNPTATSANASGLTAPITADGLDQSKATKYTLPPNLVPEDNQFQFEVVFCTKKIVNVFLQEDNYVPDIIASKPYTLDTSHLVGFGVFRCDQRDGSPNKSSFRLNVKAFDGNGVLLTSTVMPSVGVSKYAEYNEFNEGDKEYEWTFYAVVDGVAERLCHVRFFPLAKEDHEGFDFNQNFMVFENTALIKNDFGGNWRKVTYHKTNLSIPSHEARALRADNSDSSTIGLPNTRHESDHRELMPPLLEVGKGADGRFKRALVRRYERHIKRHTLKVASINPIDERTKDVMPYNAAANELLIVAGGVVLADGLANLGEYLIEKALLEESFTSVNKLFDLLRDKISSLSTPLAKQQARELKEGIVDKLNANPDHPMHPDGIGGATCTTALQFGFSYSDYLKAIEGEPEVMGCVTGGGIRVSLAINKHSQAISDLSSQPNKYSISDEIKQRPDGEYKLGIVFIAKSYNSEAIFLHGASIDLEITLSLTVKRGFKPRLDSIQIDPVLDFDTSKIMGKIGLWMYGKTAERTNKLFLAAVKFDAPTSITDSALAVATGFDGVYAASVAYGLAGVGTLISGLGDMGLQWRNIGPTSYETFEISPLRILFVNGNVNDPDVPFPQKFRPVLVGYSIGFKYIGGIGVKYQTPSSKSGRERITKVFLRYVAITEVYGAVGSNLFVQAYGYPLSHAGGGG